MHYQGTKVPLSEKNARFKSAGIPARRAVNTHRVIAGDSRKEKEKKKFSFRMFVSDSRVEKNKAGGSYCFYRPGVPPQSEIVVEKNQSEKGKRRWRMGQKEDDFDSWEKKEPLLPRSSSFKGLKYFTIGSLAIFMVLTLGWAKQKAAGVLENAPQMKLSRIVVEGEHYLTQEQVLEAAHLSLGVNLFKLNLRNIDDKLGKLSWVGQVFVERSLPSSIIISLQERKPVAVLDCGSLYGVDSQGRILSPSEALLDQDLPLISGVSFEPEAVGTTLEAQVIKPALDFFVFLDKKDSVLAHDVSEVNLSEPDSLKVTFINGMEATFNATVSSTDMERMALVLGDLNDKGQKAQTMDFRYRNMVFVRAR